ncbi:MAG: 2Fe-2S iron-sulfur cluster-binding protein [Litorimonas sp.]
MVNFYPLRVTEIRKDIRDAVIVTLKPNDEDLEAFKYVPGQYLTFKKDFEGEELRRSYSICSSALDNELRIGIKKVDGGWFSRWANEDLAVGDVIETMSPRGKFFDAIEPEKNKNYLMFAVGSGITPILSLAKTILESEPHSKIILTYVNRSFNTIMFREELSDLKDRFLTRLSVLHILKTDAGDIDMLSGRVDADKLDQLFTRWMAPAAADKAFICGPRELLFLIVDRLKAHGMEKDKIKIELFASAPPKKARPKTKGAAAKKDIKATVIIDGQTRVFEMARTGETLLEAALEANIDLPFSCKGGVCSTCCAKVIKGEVEMQMNYALEDYEVERGLALTCQAIPLTDEVTISFDEH